jgi:hypothetical protein
MILRRAAVVSMFLALTCAAGTVRAQETPATAEPAAAAPAATAPGAPSSEPPATTSHRTAWPWIVMGTGVALVVTAAVIAVHAVAEDDRREKDETKLFSTPQGDPERKALQESAESHDTSAKNGRTAALVIGTVGFLAMAGSVVWWFVEGASSTPDASATSKTSKTRLKPSFTPALSPGYAGAMLGASF